MNEKSNPAPGSSMTGSSIGNAVTSSTAGASANEAPLKSAALETGRDIARDAKHIAGDVAGTAKRTVDTRLSTSKDRVAGTLDTVADALRRTGDHLQREKDPGSIPGYVSQAAERVESASTYLQTRTLSEIVGDVERFARREPALFLGGAFIAGLVGGRFLKSSAPKPPGLPTAGRAAGATQSEPWRREATRRAPNEPAQRRSPEAFAGTSPPRPGEPPPSPARPNASNGGPQAKSETRPGEPAKSAGTI